jgi:hypothetical protein
MQNPIDQAEAEAEAEAPIPIKTESNDEDMNCTVAVRRKAAKRTLPWDLSAGELHLMSSQPPQNEEIPAPARKKQRLEEPLPTTRDEAARKTASPDVTVGLPPPPAADDGDDANPDSVTDTQPNSGVSTRATGIWTVEEDAKLTSAITSTSQMMWGKEYKTDFDAVAALVPGRTQRQCRDRWKDVLDPSSDRGSTDKWTADEDKNLKDAVRTYDCKDWAAISALVPGRTTSQCSNRWNSALKPSIALMAGRTGKWEEDEDSKLKAAVQTHGGKNWGSIVVLVPGRTKKQCWSRWHDALDPSIDRVNGRTGEWTAVEDSKLEVAVQTHGGKNWKEIAEMVPGRTPSQCCSRWNNALNPSITLTAGRKGKWTEDEDSKLKDVVHTHGAKDWAAISALIPGRTKIQCGSRWHNALDPGIGQASGRQGKWIAIEDSTLKYAVQTHGGKDWVAISALVPGRTKKQCWSRWHDALDPSIDRGKGTVAGHQKKKTR